jgi:hypothetical protein
MYKGLLHLLFFTRSCLPAIHLLQTLALLSRKTTTALLLRILSSGAPLFYGQGGNSRAVSSKRVIEEDEEQILKVIENREFLSMRAAASTWSVLVTKEEQLKELVDEGLL